MGLPPRKGNQVGKFKWICKRAKWICKRAMIPGVAVVGVLGFAVGTASATSYNTGYQGAPYSGVGCNIATNGLDGVSPGRTADDYVDFFLSSCTSGHIFTAITTCVQDGVAKQGAQATWVYANNDFYTPPCGVTPGGSTTWFGVEVIDLTSGACWRPTVFNMNPSWSTSGC